MTNSHEGSDDEQPRGAKVCPQLKLLRRLRNRRFAAANPAVERRLESTGRSTSVHCLKSRPP